MNPITYFETEGRGYIDTTLGLVKRVAEEQGIHTLVIASTSGFTAEKAVETLHDLGASFTFVGTARSRFSSEVLKQLEETGHHVCFSREVPCDYTRARS
ncbi:MAG: hypothetical protein NWE83_02445 [Candidatus Bathyarchaeota archaeon]|nr:hypothetical protein [Candidatus Bathyarchaeota archaeon]